MSGQRCLVKFYGRSVSSRFIRYTDHESYIMSRQVRLAQKRGLNNVCGVVKISCELRLFRLDHSESVDFDKETRFLPPFLHIPNPPSL